MWLKILSTFSVLNTKTAYKGNVLLFSICFLTDTFSLIKLKSIFKSIKKNKCLWHAFYAVYVLWMCFSCTQIKLKTHSYSLKIWRQALDDIYHHSLKKKNYLAKPKKHTVFLQEIRPPLKNFRYRISVLTLAELSEKLRCLLINPEDLGLIFFSAFASNNCLCWVLERILIFMASNGLFHALWLLLELFPKIIFS